MTGPTAAAQHGHKKMTKHTLKVAAMLTLVATAAIGQVDQSVTYTEVPAATQVTGGNDVILSVAAYKICQIKNFLFAAVYVLSAIAFVIFAIRALFTKFEIKQFLPILGAIFVVATADLFIAFFSDQAYYCPTIFSQL